MTRHFAPPDPLYEEKRSRKLLKPAPRAKERGILRHSPPPGRLRPSLGGLFSPVRNAPCRHIWRQGGPPHGPAAPDVAPPRGSSSLLSLTLKYRPSAAYFFCCSLTLSIRRWRANSSMLLAEGSCSASYISPMNCRLRASPTAAITFIAWLFRLSSGDLANS